MLQNHLSPETGDTSFNKNSLKTFYLPENSGITAKSTTNNEYTSAFSNYQLSFSKKKRRKHPESVSNFTFCQSNQVTLQSQGLKDISKQVVSIIKASGRTTYKAISDKIVKQTNIVFEKDAKNIRRRIYDALNVLKAINVFKQNDKVINWSMEPNTSDELNYLNTEIEKQHKNIKEKNEEKQKLAFHNAMYYDMIKRNKENENTQVDPNDKINIPFLVLTYPKKNLGSSIMVGCESKKKIHISNSYPMSVSGDYDIIKKLYIKNNT